MRWIAVTLFAGALMPVTAAAEPEKNVVHPNRRGRAQLRVQDARGLPVRARAGGVSRLDLCRQSETLRGSAYYGCGPDRRGSRSARKTLL
jgi:hypothetical protein